MPALAPERRAAIVADLRAGKSQNSTARRHGADPATVNRIARIEGIAPNIAAPKNAAAARTVYSLEARLELSDALFEKARSFVPLVKRPAELRDLATAFAILTDKRRLEEGLDKPAPGSAALAAVVVNVNYARPEDHRYLPAPTASGAIEGDFRG